MPEQSLMSEHHAPASTREWVPARLAGRAPAGVPCGVMSTDAWPVRHLHAARQAYRQSEGAAA
ncbi:MAG: hypothetical protein SV108_01535 [Pseudomonadota bacterium]|nr:hypothetical protein [Pseudomonadota bacterium]